MQDIRIYEKYFCKGEITNKDIADYIAQWLPDHQRLLENINKKPIPLGRRQEDAVKHDVMMNIGDNKRVTTKLYNDDPLNSDDAREILIYLESAQKAMHQLLPDEKVVGLDGYIDKLKNV